MAVEIEGLAGGERVHADGGVIKVVTDVEFSFGHGAEHMSQTAHRVESAAAKREGGQWEIEMIRGRIVVPHN